MVRLIYCKPMPASTLAEVYKVSMKTIRRVQTSAAHAYMAWQLRVLNHVLQTLREQPPAVAVASWMWDETAQR
eukprot:3411197-Lingulodinium_polyedra.AAC.1